jgi:hypothetical protein
MADMVTQRNISAVIDVKAMSASLSWTAGDGSDSATFTGLSVDRGAASGGQLMPESMDVDVYFDATLASGATLTITPTLQNAPDGSTWTTYATEGGTVVATGPSGGGRVEGVFRMAAEGSSAPTGAPGVQLLAAERYLRLMLIPHLSSTETDTAVIAAIGVFGGYDRLPAPNP